MTTPSAITTGSKIALIRIDRNSPLAVITERVLLQSIIHHAKYMPDIMALYAIFSGNQLVGALSLDWTPVIKIHEIAGLPRHPLDRGQLKIINAIISLLNGERTSNPISLNIVQ